MAIYPGRVSGSPGAQGPQGPQGPAGPVGPSGLEWKGQWSSSASYVVDDAVGYNGASYFCIAANSNTPPTELPTDTVWALLASQGSPGPQGPQGIQGEDGPQGIPGVKGETGDAGPEGPQGPSGITSERRKSECFFSGLSLAIPTTATNLINLIKALTHTGSMSPFFNTTTNKFNVFNVNSTTTFKLNITGSWSGASSNRSMTVSFPSTNGNTLVASRDQAVTTDVLSFPTFFSVDENGSLATSGSDITIQSNGATFTATSILIIAEQMVPEGTP